MSARRAYRLIKANFINHGADRCGSCCSCHGECPLQLTLSLLGWEWQYSMPLSAWRGETLLLIRRDVHLLQVYHDLCAGDGLSLTEPASHKVKDYCLASMPGAYRQLAVRPPDLTWQLLQYSQPDAPLAISELDRACGKGDMALQCTQLNPGAFQALREPHIAQTVADQLKIDQAARVLRHVLIADAATRLTCIFIQPIIARGPVYQSHHSWQQRG